MTTLLVEVDERLVLLSNLRAAGRFNSPAEKDENSGNIAGGSNGSVRGDNPSILGVGDGVIAKGPDGLKSLETDCGVADAENDWEDTAKVTGGDTDVDITGPETMACVADVDAGNGGIVEGVDRETSGCVADDGGIVDDVEITGKEWTGCVADVDAGKGEIVDDVDRETSGCVADDGGIVDDVEITGKESTGCVAGVYDGETMGCDADNVDAVDEVEITGDADNVDAVDDVEITVDG